MDRVCKTLPSSETDLCSGFQQGSFTHVWGGTDGRRGRDCSAAASAGLRSAGNDSSPVRVSVCTKSRRGHMVFVWFFFLFLSTQHLPAVISLSEKRKMFLVVWVDRGFAQERAVTTGVLLKLHLYLLAAPPSVFSIQVFFPYAPFFSSIITIIIFFLNKVKLQNQFEGNYFQAPINNPRMASSQIKN